MTLWDFQGVRMNNENIIKKISKLTALTLFVFILLTDTGRADFSYKIKNPSLESAGKYVTSTSNINIHTEGDFTYLCPAKGAATVDKSTPGVIRYHFSFAVPISEAKLFVNTDTFHWSYSQGFSYVYASVDGINWIKLAEAAPPELGKWRSGNASGSLPAVFIGKKDIYVTVMLYSFGPSASKGGIWCNTAQHLRYNKKTDNVTFQLDVKNVAGPVSELIADVNGNAVSFDWTAMAAAGSYTLAVALADEFGDIDMSSLNLIDMGDAKTFSSFGLPSGMIFYAAVLANSSEGLQISNTVKFLPIAGTVTGPGVIEGVLTAINDPGGIGTITLFGSITGDTANITRLSGDDGTGPFVLNLTDNKPATYTKGGQTMVFTYPADGSISVATLRQRSLTRESAADDCQAAIQANIDQLEQDFRCELNNLTGLARVFSDLGIGSYGLGAVNNRCLFLAGLCGDAIKDLKIKFQKDKSALIKQYNACNYEPEPEPDPGDGEIVIDLTCPVPSGAEHKEDHYSTSSIEHYVLNGEDVGPWRWWGLDTSGDNTYLKSESCKNAAGQLNGWVVYYYENGNMRVADHYTNGIHDGHEYHFYCNGTIWRDLTIVDGICTYAKYYDANGSLNSYWDKADGVTHIIGKGEMGSLDCY